MDCDAQRPRPLLRRCLAAAILLALVGTGFLLPLAEWSTALTDLFTRLGHAGSVAFIALFVAWGMVLPKGPLVAVAGAAFGLLKGLLLVYVATTVAMLAAFWLARRYGRARTAQWLERHPRLAACERAIAKRGVRIVFLLRLSPVIPGHVQNYLYGLSRVPLRDCLLASWVGILPGTAMLVAGGQLLASGGDSGAWTWAIAGLGIIATVVAATAIARMTRAELRAAAVPAG